MGVEKVKDGVSEEIRARMIENPIRRFDSVQKLEWFLISAVVMVLVIRTQLWLTNYPQLGGGNLHIAHLLWGGLFMMIAIWVSLIYLNRRAVTTMAILGGIGFGFFIDELGKFITADNDYFYKPAAALIYLIFVILFLIIREFSRRQRQNRHSALANAMSFMPYTVTGEFGRDDYKMVSQLLDQADDGTPRVERLREYFEQTALAPTRPPSRLLVLRDRIHAWVGGLSRRRHFRGVITTIVVTWGLLSLLAMFQIVVVFGADAEMSVEASDTGFLAFASSISTFASGVLVLIGILKLRRNERQKAYRYFRRALLVSIFVTRVFSFVETQFGAVFGLVIDIALYAALGELATRDEQDGPTGPLTDNRQNGSDGEEEAQGGPAPAAARVGDQ